MSYSSTILGDTPAAYYRLGESSGTTATDASGNSRNGTYSGSGITYAQTGLLTGDADTCVLLDGSAGIVTIPNSTQLAAPISIECWIKSTNIASPGYFVTSAAWGFGWNTTGNHIHIYGLTVGGGGSFETSNTLSTGNTYYVVLTIDGSMNFTAYVGTGGSVTNWGSANPGGSSLNYGSQPSRIGSDGTSLYKGLIDEVAIYGAVLSGTQMNTHYTAGTTSPGGATHLRICDGYGGVFS